MGHAGTHWIFTTFVLLGDMFGLGTLTLPADFARLGWAVALPVIAICALGMVYSGVLFGRLAVHLPSSHAFDQLGVAAFGAHGKRMVYATVYLTILFEPVIFHLTCMESLQQMLYSANVSQLAAGCIVAVLIFPLGLVQGIEEVSAVAILGTVGMLVAVVTATYKLWSLHAIDFTPTEVVHHGQFNMTLVAIMDLVSNCTFIALACSCTTRAVISPYLFKEQRVPAVACSVLSATCIAQEAGVSPERGLTLQKHTYVDSSMHSVHHELVARHLSAATDSDVCFPFTAHPAGACEV